MEVEKLKHTHYHKMKSHLRQLSADWWWIKQNLTKQKRSSNFRLQNSMFLFHLKINWRYSGVWQLNKKLLNKTQIMLWDDTNNVLGEFWSTWNAFNRIGGETIRTWIWWKNCVSPHVIGWSEQGSTGRSKQTSCSALEMKSLCKIHLSHLRISLPLTLWTKTVFSII